MTEHYIGAVTDFPDDEGTEVTINGISIAVFNLEDGLYAIQNSCPHKQYPLHPCGEKLESSREGGRRGHIDSDERTINCPWHGLELDLENGEAPALNARVASYDVDVRDGDVYVEI